MANESIVRIGADASDLQRGLQQGERSLNQFANTAENTGRRSSASLNRTSEATTQTAQAQERATRSIERSLQREIALREAGERGSRQYYESLAQQRGADVSRLTPMLNQLDSLRQRTDGLTISQGQYNAALRMMPAQMTDIVTQLAGGQSPFLIAIQQGGQMRDSFGGFGNMFRGIAASVSPMKLAMGGLVGVLGATAYAAYEGSQELSKFENALTLSGERAGITADQLQTVAHIVGESTGSYTLAAEAVLAFAQQGQIAERDYTQFASAISLMSQATGRDVADLVSEFAKIGDDPVKAVLELSNRYKTMTADVYAQVESLKAQGKEQEAVRLVQKLYADESAEMSQKVLNNLGLIEETWRNIKQGAVDAWEAMKSIGRDTTLDEKISELNKKIRGQDELKAKWGGGNDAYRAQLIAERDQLIKQRDNEAKRAAQEQEEKRKSRESMEAQKRMNQRSDSLKTPIERAQDDLKKIKSDYDAAIAGVKDAATKQKLTAQYQQQLARKNAELVDLQAKEKKAAEREAQSANKRDRHLLPTTAAGLRMTSTAESYVGGKKRFTHGGTYAAAHSMQKLLGNELTYFTAFNDAYHHSERYFAKKGNRNSGTHGAGLALDFGLKGGKKTAPIATARIVEHLKQLGFKRDVDYTLLDEYTKPSKGATGGHIHFNWKSATAAARFAQSDTAKAMSKAGIYESFKSVAAAPKKSDYEQYREQSNIQQERARIGRELRASGEHKVITNELALRSRPEFKNWTKAQQETELKAARAADKVATDEKIQTLTNNELAKLERTHALIGKVSEADKLRYDLEYGYLKVLDPARKAEILARHEANTVAQKQYETDKKYSDLLDELAAQTMTNFNQQAFELSLKGKTASEISRLTLAREYDMKIMQATADGASAVYIDALQQQKIAAEQSRAEFERMKEVSGMDWLEGINDGMTEYISSFATMRDSMSGMVSQTLGGMTNLLSDFVATGKADFRSFSVSVIQDISKMMLKMAIFNAMKSASSAMSGQGGWIGAIGSALSGAFSDGGYTGHGGKYEPAGIVHKGEYVLSQENLRTLGGVSVVENLLHRAKGYSSGGLVGGGVNTAGLHASLSAATAAPVINITVNVSGGSNKEEARQGAEEGVQAGLRKMMSEIADSRIFEHCRPGNVIYQTARS